MSEDKIKGKIYISRCFQNRKTLSDFKIPSILPELWTLHTYMLFDCFLMLFVFKTFFFIFEVFICSCIKYVVHAEKCTIMYAEKKKPEQSHSQQMILIVSTDTQEWKTWKGTDAYKYCWENKLQISISFMITSRFHIITTSGCLWLFCLCALSFIVSVSPSLKQF